LWAYSEGIEAIPQLHVWQMNEGNEFPLIYQESYPKFCDDVGTVIMDDQYVAITVLATIKPLYFSVHFISTETMKFERSLSLKTHLFRYDSGLLFIVQNNAIRFVLFHFLPRILHFHFIPF
jgi:hypothetical protein